MRTNAELTQQLIESNREDYNIDKCLEEIFELGEKLMKFKNKKPEYKPTAADIIEEIGDLFVRLEVVAHTFGADAVQERIDKKSKTLLSGLLKGLYKGGI